MKKFIFFARVYTCWLLSIPTVLQAQNIDPYPNYVVVGAFAHEGNAVFWTKDANDNRFKAHFEINPNRNLFYVYVVTTSDRNFAFQEALKLRKETKYFDTWVYSGPLGKDALQSGADRALYFDPSTQEQITAVTAEQKSTSIGVDLNSKAQTSLSTTELTSTTGKAGQNNSKARLTAGPNDIVSGDNSVETSGEELKTGPDGKISEANVKNGNAKGTVAAQDRELTQTTSQSAVDQSQKAASNSAQNVAKKNDELAGKNALAGSAEKDSAKDTVQKATPRPDNAKPLTSEEIVGKNFYFQLFRDSNNDLIEGEVDAIDVEKSRRMATYKANTAVKVLMPMGKSKQVSFVSEVFGYRRLQKDFDPNSPSEEFYLDQDNHLVIPFQLARLQKGDIAIMYNVFFFKDAGVMRPESRYEVNNLLELLNENPAYKIVIHGHTNGNANGKILSLGNGSENFYSLTGTREGIGSAKKLSEERAEVMKKYLVSKGVEPDRMQIKAWGGKKPIHDKHAVRANENVRVEIEILSN